VAGRGSWAPRTPAKTSNFRDGKDRRILVFANKSLG